MRFSPRANTIRIKNEENLAAMRRAGRLASECLEWILGQVEPGMCTLDIDDLQMQFARRHDVTPAPLGYKGFPRSICTSRNEVICHGIPSRDVVLREGDIVGIDVTLIVEGMHGDNAATVPVGEVAPESMHLLVTTLEAQRRGIQAVRPGARLGDIGHAIQSVVEPEGYSVVRDFVGHGIGRGFHEEPQIPHFGEPGRGLRLRAGMTFTVEPMINAGVPDVEIQGDGWTALTGDRRLSAQYEHTLEVTDEGVRVLTVQNDEGTWEPPGRWWPPGFRFGDVG
jgi:methionyl aminopeptidase